jgi:hypothetical protein
MELAKKLQLKPAQRVEVLPGPAVDPPALEGIVPGTGASDDALLVWARLRSDVDELASAIAGAARAGRLTWVAYPKAGQLGTDLNRDSLAELLTGNGFQPVRQIAIDATWSALRVRPL